MKHTTEAHLLITTFVGSACLIAGFIIGAIIVTGKQNHYRDWETKPLS